MRWFTAAAIVACLSMTTQAHHPDREHQHVHPRYDLIGPLGNRLPISYRRRFNRPTNLGGKIAYYIAPSSQEAMAWHDATHRRAYKDHRPRIEMHYFYPKPWEVIRKGSRPETGLRPERNVDQSSTAPIMEEIQSPLSEASPSDLEANEAMQNAIEKTDEAIENLENKIEGLQDADASPSDQPSLSAPASSSAE